MKPVYHVPSLLYTIFLLTQAPPLRRDEAAPACTEEAMAGEQPFCHPAGVTRWMTHPRAQGRLSGCRGRPPLRADRRFLRRGGGLPRPAANRSVNENGAANSYRLRIRRTFLAVKDGYRREGQDPPLRTLKKNDLFPRKGLDKYIGRRYIRITI